MPPITPWERAPTGAKRNSATAANFRILAFMNSRLFAGSITSGRTLARRVVGEQRFTSATNSAINTGLYLGLAERATILPPCRHEIAATGPLGSYTVPLVRIPSRSDRNAAHYQFAYNAIRRSALWKATRIRPSRRSRSWHRLRINLQHPSELATMESAWIVAPARESAPNRLIVWNPELPRPDWRDGRPPSAFH